MPNTEEQRVDVIENCNVLLQTILKPFAQTDDTPEGRMIAQLKWLKERADNHDLPLPVDRNMLSTLLYVYTDGELCRHASSPDRVIAEIEIYMNRLISLTEEARLLLKPPYFPYAIRCIDALSMMLRTAPRPLNQHEQGLIGELMQLKQLLSGGKIEPPLCIKSPYANFMDARRSVRDLPKGKLLYETVDDLIFSGIRPDTWLTPADADRETANM
jgi:hypothetical protein